jgi:AcrR family transcriptional regulator
VSRMTIYYHIGSRAGLLEDVLDDLGTRGGLEDIAGAMQLPHGTEAIGGLVAVFCRFWSSQRVVIRKLRAMAALDPDLAGVFRDERRRQMLRASLERALSASGSTSARRCSRITSTSPRIL